MNAATALKIMDDENQAEPVRIYSDNVVTLGVTSDTQLCPQSPNENEVVMVGADMKQGEVRTGADMSLPVKKDSLRVDEFAKLISKSERTVRRICVGAAKFEKWNWNGEEVDLIVKRVASETGGGDKGFTYIVVAKSLPLELQRKWYSQFIEKVEVPVEKTFAEDAINLSNTKKQIDKRVNQAQQNQAWLAPILAAPKGSSLRSKLIDQAVGMTYWDSGNKKEKKLARSTIYYWIKKVEKQGVAGYTAKVRTDAGKKRCIISTKWDKAMRGLIQMGLDITEQQLEQTEKDLFDYIRGLLKGGLSQPKTCNNASFELNKRTRALLHQRGQALTIEQASEFCTISRHVVQTIAKEGWKAAYLKVHDAKAYYDNYMPSIQRHRNDLLPNQIVMGDVHKMDTPVERDGRAYFPSAIAWMDLATNRVRVDFTFTEKGKGVNQTDVIISYMNTVLEWGFIHTLYLDNGSEYRNADWIAGIEQLHRATQEVIDIKSEVPEELRETYRSVIREAPFNAKGKGLEEGFFANWEYTFMNWRLEHFGGRRDKGKLPALGAKPLVVEDRNEYEIWAQETLDIYHTVQQGGWLNGLSPNEKLNEFISNGWRKIDVKWSALDVVFAKRDSAVAGSNGKAGVFTVKDNRYFSEYFARLTGIKHEILIPITTQKYIYVIDNIHKKPVQVMLDTIHSYFGHDNQVDSRQRKAKADALVDHMIANSPDINVHEAMLEESHHKEQAQTPENKAVVDIEILQADVKRIAEQNVKPSADQTRYGAISDLIPDFEITYEDEDDE